MVTSLPHEVLSVRFNVQCCKKLRRGEWLLCSSEVNVVLNFNIPSTITTTDDKHFLLRKVNVGNGIIVCARSVLYTGKGFSFDRPEQWITKHGPPPLVAYKGLQVAGDGRADLNPISEHRNRRFCSTLLIIIPEHSEFANSNRKA